jgi:macrolide-specific efflux system membrane fusion protein
MLQKLDSNGLRTRTQDYLKRSRMRVLLAGLLAAGVIVAGIFYFSGPRGGSGGALRTEEVTRGNIERTVTAVGQIRPKTFVDVGTQVSGQLRKVNVEIGEVVEQGKLVAEIDPTVYQTKVLGNRAQIDNLKAQLAQSEAQLVLDRARSARSQQLLSTNATSKDAAEATTAAMRITEAKIDSFKAQIKQTEATLEGDIANLGYTKIHAPMPGTIVSQTAYEGQTLNANQTAPIILRIADLDTMTVWAQVAESDIPRVKPGMEVYFTTLGMPDQRFKGKVNQIYPTPDVLNDVVLYNVLIDVQNKERLLMTNMTAQVFFVLDSAENVALVPMAALLPSPRGGEGAYTARVMTGDGVVTRRVRAGITNRQYAEVKEGLKPGDRVVLGGEAAAQQGQQRPLGFRKF